MTEPFTAEQWKEWLAQFEWEITSSIVANENGCLCKVGHLITTEMRLAIGAAIAKARRETALEAEKWHNEQAFKWNDTYHVSDVELHEKSAKHFRQLADSYEVKG